MAQNQTQGAVTHMSAGYVALDMSIREYKTLLAVVQEQEGVDPRALQSLIAQLEDAQNLAKNLF
jgi:hypothetical protein